MDSDGAFLCRTEIPNSRLYEMDFSIGFQNVHESLGFEVSIFSLKNVLRFLALKIQKFSRNFIKVFSNKLVLHL